MCDNLVFSFHMNSAKVALIQARIARQHATLALDFDKQFPPCDAAPSFADDFFEQARKYRAQAKVELILALHANTKLRNLDTVWVPNPLEIFLNGFYFRSWPECRTAYNEDKMFAGRDPE